MRGRKYYFIIALISLLMILIILGVYLLNISQQNDIQEVKPPMSKEIDKKDNFIEPEQLVNAVKKMEENMENMQIKNLDLNEDISVENRYISPFEEVDISDVHTIKIDDVKPISAIYVKKNSIASANIGDTIELPLLGTSNYRIKVTQKQKNGSGSITISGNLIEDNKYSATFTESKKGIYGSITTPDGAYELESQDGEGYIYSLKDIEKKRVNYKQSDEIEIGKK